MKRMERLLWLDFLSDPMAAEVCVLINSYHIGITSLNYSSKYRQYAIWIEIVLTCVNWPNQTLRRWLEAFGVTAWKFYPTLRCSFAGSRSKNCGIRWIGEDGTSKVVSAFSIAAITCLAVSTGSFENFAWAVRFFLVESWTFPSS